MDCTRDSFHCLSHWHFSFFGNHWLLIAMLRYDDWVTLKSQVWVAILSEFVYSAWGYISIAFLFAALGQSLANREFALHLWYQTVSSNPCSQKVCIEYRLLLLAWLQCLEFSLASMFVRLLLFVRMFTVDVCFIAGSITLKLRVVFLTLVFDNAFWRFLG